MATAEIIVISPPGKAADKTATALFNRVRSLGGEVQKVASVGDEPQAIADEVRAALTRRPGLLLLIGGEPDVVVDGLARGGERPLVDGLPQGAARLPSGDGVTMLIASTYVATLPGQEDPFEAAWRDDLGPSVAQWLGRPTHVKGELVVLDAGMGDVEGLLAGLAEQHPEAYLRAEPDPSGGVTVSALAAAGADTAEDLADMALSAVERAAVAARLRIASTGRQPAERVNASGP